MTSYKKCKRPCLSLVSVTDLTYIYFLQWITLFDDSAKKIIGKSAKEMASIKESNEIEFRRILHQARYRQFNFSVKTSKETWNDEDRLKVTATNVEPIDAQTRRKHIERLKAEIEALQLWDET